MMLFLWASLPRLLVVPSFRIRTGCPDWVVVKYAIQIPPFVKMLFLAIPNSKKALKYKLLLLFLQMHPLLGNSLNFGLLNFIFGVCHAGFGALLHKP
jgi:hypothetical protein